MGTTKVELCHKDKSQAIFEMYCFLGRADDSTEHILRIILAIV